VEAESWREKTSAPDEVVVAEEAWSLDSVFLGHSIDSPR
jgi:hypothetical protein